jgi:hypothetical protein
VHRQFLWQVANRNKNNFELQKPNKKKDSMGIIKAIIILERPSFII